MGRKIGSARKWLYPGLGVKRWLGLLLIGITALALGLAYFLYDVYTAALISSPVWRVLTLAFLPRWARTSSIVVIGLVLVSVAVYQLNRSLLAAFVPPGSASEVPEWWCWAGATDSARCCVG